MQMLIPGRGFLHGQTSILNNDQIKTLPSDGFLLVPAPGPDKLIIPLSGFIKLDLITGYTLSGIASLVLIILPGAYLSSILAMSQLSSSGVAFQQFLCPYAEVGSNDFDGIVITNCDSISPDSVNKALYLKDDYNGLDPYTGGDPLNTLLISIQYLILNTLTGQFE